MLDLNQKWKLFEEYSELGFDPLRWLSECSNELKHDKLEEISEELKRNNLRITPGHYSYFHYPDKKDVEIIRRIYRIGESDIKQEDLKTKKAISIIKCDKNIVDDTELLTNEIKKISANFETKTEIEKISIIPTNSKEFQFMLFDHIKPQRGNKIGYTLVTNSNTQATDVTLSIRSPIHMQASLTESINLLNIMGCTKDIKLYPIYDAPNDELLDEIRKDIDTFTIKYNYTYEDYSSLRLGTLFFGTTAVGNTHKEIPNKYDLIQEGDQIILTDKLGLLAYLSLHVITNIDDRLFERMRQAGIDQERFSILRQMATENLTDPKITVGKVISKYLPDFENPFELDSHILVTHPVSKAGIYSSLYELSKLVNKDLIIDDVPFVDKEIADFLSKEHLVSNVSASTSNVNILVVSKNLSDIIIEDLVKGKLNPTLIGRVGTSTSTSSSGKPIVKYTKKQHQQQQR